MFIVIVHCLPDSLVFPEGKVILKRNDNFNKLTKLRRHASRIKKVWAQLREGLKKNCEKAVRLTAWVDPPLPSPEAVRKM